MVTTGAIRRAKFEPNRQETNAQFFTGQMPFLSPHEECQNTEGNKVNTRFVLLSVCGHGLPAVADAVGGGGGRPIAPCNFW